MKDWRGEWLNLHDLAKLLGKSYNNLYTQYVRAEEYQVITGVRLVKSGGRLWARVDQSILNRSF